MRLRQMSRDQRHVIGITIPAQHPPPARKRGVTAPIGGSQIDAGHRLDSPRAEQAAIVAARLQWARTGDAEVMVQARAPVRETRHQLLLPPNFGMMMGATVQAFSLPRPQSTSTFSVTDAYFLNVSVGARAVRLAFER